MTRSLRIFPRADADVERIFVWLARRSPQGAAAWYAAFSATIGRIVDNPVGFAVASEALPRWNRDIRQTLFKTARGNRYRIVFELTESEIRILRVRGPGQPPLRRRDLPSA
jgi:plasmid stabilization system protein ParE